MHRLPILIFTQLFLAMLLCRCNLEEIPSDGTVLKDAPEITDINPDRGRAEDMVVLTGNNFGTDETALTVKFYNDKTAEIFSISNTELEVKVPQGAGTGPVSIEYSTQSVDGPEFTYLLSGTVTIFAGSGESGFQDGSANVARFFFPYGLAVDEQDNIYVGDLDNARIRKITPTGTVSTIAGTGSGGFDNGPGSVATFNLPAGLDFNKNGELIVADFGNHAIRSIDLSNNNTVTTEAGSGERGYRDNFGTGAQFNYPTGVVIDENNNILVADRSNNVIRVITPGGSVSTFAGTGTDGDKDGDRINVAQFSGPEDLAIDKSGNIFITDSGNHKIKKVAMDGTVTTFAGNGVSGNINGVGTGAQFNSPIGIDVDDKGNLYVADRYNHKVRIVTPEGLTYDLAGDGSPGNREGPGLEAQLSSPFGIVLDSEGNVYVANYGNDTIRKITVF